MFFDQCKNYYELGQDYLIYARGFSGAELLSQATQVSESIFQVDIEEELIQEELLQLIEESFEAEICRHRLLNEATEDLEALGAPSFTVVEPSVWGQIKALSCDGKLQTQ